MKALHMIAFIILVIGGLNWGLEIFDYGLGNYVGELTAQIVYGLVALSAIYEIVTHKVNCKRCTSGDGMSASS